VSTGSSGIILQQIHLVRRTQGKGKPMTEVAQAKTNRADLLAAEFLYDIQ
jgi:hypothetical protein